MTTQNSVPMNIYRAHLMRARSMGNYMSFFFPYINIMNLAEMVFIQDMINLAEAPWTKVDKNGYFQCTSKALKSRLKWDDSVQTKLLDRLKKKGFIKVIRKGSPPKRYVWIDLVRMESALDAGLQSTASAAIHSTASKVDSIRDKNYILNSLAGLPATAGQDQSGRDSHMRSSLSGAASGASKPVEKFAVELAQRLRQTVKNKRPTSFTSNQQYVHSYEPKLSTCAKEFQILLNKVKCPSRVDVAMDWLVENYGEKYTPQVFTGKQFRQKFDQIERARLRKIETDVLKNISISSKSEEILKRLYMRQWPKGSHDQLPAAVEISRQAYAKLLDALAPLVKTTPMSTVLANGSHRDNPRGYFLKMLWDWLPDHNHFIENWFASIHQRVVNWQEWNGDLRPFLFRMDHHQFTTDVKNKAAQGGYASYHWDEILKEISK